MFNKKIAIQLYGHLRTFDKTAQTLQKYIIDANPNIEFDIFIHTWDELDSVQKMPHYEKGNTFAGKTLTEEQRQKVLDLYKPKKIIIEPQIELTSEQKDIVTSSNYDMKLATVFRNISHTFCSVNTLRQKYEKETGNQYDLVIVTRPDIIFYDKLNLTPFYEKNCGWNFFDENTLKDYVFSTYINGVHSVINPEKYVAGIDLLMFAHPEVLNKLAKWEENINSCLDLWAEFAIVKMLNKFNLKHSYFVYEKDKFWTITRLQNPDMTRHSLRGGGLISYITY